VVSAKPVVFGAGGEKRRFTAEAETPNPGATGRIVHRDRSLFTIQFLPVAADAFRDPGSERSAIQDHNG
jgi:hypothetical protein